MPRYKVQVAVSRDFFTFDVEADTQDEAEIIAIERGEQEAFVEVESIDEVSP